MKRATLMTHEKLKLARMQPRYLTNLAPTTMQAQSQVAKVRLGMTKAQSARGNTSSDLPRLAPPPKPLQRIFSPVPREPVKRISSLTKLPSLKTEAKTGHKLNTIWSGADDTNGGCKPKRLSRRHLKMAMLVKQTEEKPNRLFQAS